MTLCHTLQEEQRKKSYYLTQYRKNKYWFPESFCNTYTKKNYLNKSSSLLAKITFFHWFFSQFSLVLSYLPEVSLVSPNDHEDSCFQSCPTKSVIWYSFPFDISHLINYKPGSCILRIPQPSKKLFSLRLFMVISHLLTPTILFRMVYHIDLVEHDLSHLTSRHHCHSLY